MHLPRLIPLQFLNSFSQVFYVSCHCNEGVGKRIADLSWIGSNDVFALPKGNMSGHAYDCRIRRNISQYNRTGPNPGVISDLDIAQNLGAGADDNGIACSRMALRLILACTDESCALVVLSGSSGAE